MQLTAEDQRQLDGEEGPVVARAMRVLSRLGQAYGAKRFIPVTRGHLVATSYQIAGDAGIAIYQELVAMGAHVKIPTTLDPGSVDFDHWREFQIPEDIAQKQNTLRVLLEAMGVIPTWNCTPYYVANVPTFGERVAWSESSAVIFINSVIGARTVRLAAYVDLCAALAGKMPEFGLYLDEERVGSHLFEVEEGAEERFGTQLYPTLGYLIGSQVGDGLPVIDGLRRRPRFDEYKLLGAAMAASGGVAMYHVVGFTPEAPTRERAFAGKAPQHSVRISCEDLRQAIEQRISTVPEGQVDLVALGCPHASMEQLAQYAALIKGRRVHPNVKLWIATSWMVAEMAEKTGYLQTLRAAGAEILVGTCVVNAPLAGWGFHTMATDAGKFAYYAPANLGVKIVFLTTEECIDAAVSGRATRVHAS